MELPDENDHKVFDTLIVISEGNVNDTQLQDAIDSFERRAVVATIKSGEGTVKALNWSKPCQATRRWLCVRFRLFRMLWKPYAN